MPPRNPPYRASESPGRHPARPGSSTCRAGGSPGIAPGSSPPGSSSASGGGARTSLLGALLVAIVGAAAFLAAFQDFVESFDHPPPPLPARVDVIVALSGGSGRLEEGVRLLREGRAPLLFLVGFQARAVANRLDAEPALAELAREGRILVEPRSESTLDDARRTRALVLDRHARSILLITSVYHVRRAQLAFRAVLPDTVALHTWPVRSRTFRADAWYADEPSRRVVFAEFLKYLFYRLRLPFHAFAVPQTPAAPHASPAPRASAAPTLTGQALFAP